MSVYHVLVCVTGQKSCERQIREGAKIAKDMGGELSVLHVAPMGAGMLGYPVEGDAMEYLYKISSEYGADMTVMRSDDVVSSIVSFVHKAGVTIVLMGASKRKGGRDFGYELQARLPGVLFQTVSADED